MENMDKKEGMCNCDMNSQCGCGWHSKKHFYLLKVILKLVILILVFWCGFKLGQITGSIRAEYGHMGMMHEGGWMMNDSLMQGTPSMMPAPATTPAK